MEKKGSETERKQEEEGRMAAVPELVPRTIFYRIYGGRCYDRCLFFLFCGFSSHFLDSVLQSINVFTFDKV